MNYKTFFPLVGALALVALLGLVVFMRCGADNQLEKLATATEVPTVTHSPEPEYTPTPSPTMTPDPTPDPTPELPDVDLTSWELRLVNSSSPLDESHAPQVEEFENGQYFDARAVEALEAFIADARADGLTVYVTSSYRPFSTQQALFNNKVNEYRNSGYSQDDAVAQASTIVAVPGTSEHQLGLAADIVDKYYQYMNESLADTDLSKWMKEHCAEYGFILRYPQNKTEITKIMFEPWHYRYVGVEAATYIMEHGLCLEEFYELYEAS